MLKLTCILTLLHAQVFYGGHITDGMDRRCCTTYLEVLIRPDILPRGALADPSCWEAPHLELAPGFRAPLPTSYDSMRSYIDTQLPAESPVVYGAGSCDVS
jgi:dynein heavy chain